jgi:TPR repeat protein
MSISITGALVTFVIVAAGQGLESRATAPHGQEKADSSLVLSLPPHSAKDIASLRLASAHGDRDASYKLAVLFLYGAGVSKDCKQYKKLLLEAATRGYFPAERDTGSEFGLGIPSGGCINEDKVGGLTWLILAQADEPPASNKCQVLATLLQSQMSQEQITAAQNAAVVIRSKRQSNP